MTTHKIALVTGGSRGIGKTIATSLAKKGLTVIITYYKNQNAAKTVVSEIERLGQTAKAFQLDTRNIENFKPFFSDLTNYLTESFGNPNLDFLINNAGTGLYKPISDTSETEFDDMLNIHFKGVYFFTQQALPYINDNGSIINISSGLTRFSFPGSSAYAAMKGAIEVFSRYLAKEFGHRGITSNTVAPGAIATDFGGGSNRDNEEKRQIISNVTALGGVGEAHDIGGVVAFLCTEEAHWINGQRIEVSGGMLV